MKNFIELVKKYKLQILYGLLFIFTFRSCVKSSEIRKLDKIKIENTQTIDSLEFIIKGQKDTINNISEVIRQEKVKVHSEYDNYISKQNRGEQLMDLHMIVKNNIKKLQK